MKILYKVTILLTIIPILYFINIDKKTDSSITFKEIESSSFFPSENKKDEECYREVLKNDSIRRPDSTRRDIVKPIEIEDNIIVGDYQNLPVSYLDKSIMSCIKNVGSRSMALFDINNDSYLDIMRAPDLILTNNQKSGFTVSKIELLEQEKLNNIEESILPDYISRAGNPLFIDIDNDGKVELLVGTEGYRSQYLFNVYKMKNKVWINYTNKLGYKLKFKTSTAVTTLSNIDYNKDGYEDIILGWNQMTHMPEINRRTGFPNKGMVLLENNKGNGFIDVTRKSNIESEIDNEMVDNLHLGMRGKFYYPLVFPHQILPIDLDNDNWQDIIIAGDYGTGMILLNKKGSFISIDNKIFRGESLMGVAIDDINKDGLYDIFISQINGNGLFTWLCEGGRLCDNKDKGNKLFISQSDGSYLDKSKEYGLLSGGWGWGAVFADFNNDGKRELVMAAGFRHGHSPEFLGWGYRDDSPQLWEFDSNKNKYISIVNKSGLDIKKPTAAVAVGDINKDGLLDIILTEQGVKLPRIFINTTKLHGNFININPISKNEPYNKGIGAVITIKYGGYIDKYTTGINNFSHMSTGDNNIWFGTSNAKKVDIEIKYRDGSEKKYKNVKTNSSWQPN